MSTRHRLAATVITVALMTGIGASTAQAEPRYWSASTRLTWSQMWGAYKAKGNAVKTHLCNAQGTGRRPADCRWMLSRVSSDMLRGRVATSIRHKQCLQVSYWVSPKTPGGRVSIWEGRCYQ